MPAERFASTSLYGEVSKYQWLPALLIKDSDGYFQFGSYFNNLYTVKYSGLYHVISKYFNKLLPRLNLCFSRNSSEIPRRVEIPFQPYDEEVYDALPDEYCVGDDESEREASEIKKKYVNIPLQNIEVVIKLIQNTTWVKTFQN